MSETASLLPCPFCGAVEPHLTMKAPSGDVPYWCVCCEACCTQGPWEPTETIAGKVWNRRAAPTAEQGTLVEARLKSLEDRLEMMSGNMSVLSDRQSGLI